MATRLFRSAGFHGLGYLEVKHEPSTGRWLVIEANVGRPTGRSATAEAGGVELLLTMYRDATGLPLPAARRQHYTGAAWIDVRRDLLAAVHYWRLGELSVGTWWKDMCRPKVHAVPSWSDPAPFLHELGQSGRKAARRLLRRTLARSKARRTPPSVALRPAIPPVSRTPDEQPGVGPVVGTNGASGCQAPTRRSSPPVQGTHSRSAHGAHGSTRSNAS